MKGIAIPTIIALVLAVLAVLILWLFLFGGLKFFENLADQTITVLGHKLSCAIGGSVPGIGGGLQTLLGC